MKRFTFVIIIFNTEQIIALTKQTNNKNNNEILMKNKFFADVPKKRIFSRFKLFSVFIFMIVLSAMVYTFEEGVGLSHQ